MKHTKPSYPDPQLSRDEAIDLYDGKAWEAWSDRQIAEFQLFQEFLSVPFELYHQAIERVLGRPVYTHEFAATYLLQQEFLGDRPAPDLKAILDLVPKDKLVVCIPVKS